MSNTIALNAVKSYGSNVPIVATIIVASIVLFIILYLLSRDIKNE